MEAFSLMGGDWQGCWVGALSRRNLVVVVVERVKVSGSWSKIGDWSEERTTGRSPAAPAHQRLIDGSRDQIRDGLVRLQLSMTGKY